MANEQNLIKGKDTQFKSGEQAAKNGRKGGIASGVSKRRKKAFKARLKDALECAVSNGSIKKMIRQMGMEPEDATNYDALVARLLSIAVVKGDPAAIKMVLEYIGETPGEKRAAEKHKLEKRIMEEQLKTMKGADAEIADDGFMDALKASAKDDWDGDDDEPPE